ncbi:MAG: hypothetical protein HXY34_07415 [Candidatus Thorarchaeota archaeon]|nr:hypothetical protein [Candidatus Thorarchaeota archaeon]
MGSVPGADLQAPMKYVSSIHIPYWFQLPSRRNEDMIRQFAYLVEGYEERGDSILEIDIGTFRNITESAEPLLPDEEHASALYEMMRGGYYNCFKTQLTAPATMCFSIRSPEGQSLVSEDAFHFFYILMRRIAQGMKEMLVPHCKSVIMCLDDPALGLVLEVIDRGDGGSLTREHIFRSTKRVIPSGMIPAYHYCHDWRALKSHGRYPLWDDGSRVVHVDVISYPPELDPEQAEHINRFLEHGGGIALGVIPKTDEGFSKPVGQELSSRLADALSRFHRSGVSVGLLGDNLMVSTQCGIPRMTPRMAREIHEESRSFPAIVEKEVRLHS